LTIFGKENLFLIGLILYSILRTIQGDPKSHYTIKNYQLSFKHRIKNRQSGQIFHQLEYKVSKKYLH